MKKLSPLLVALSLAVASLAGCAADAPQSTAGQTTEPSTSASEPAPSSSATPAAPTAGVVDPNKASTQELVAALEAAGVDNAEKWAEEIQEYGPYTAQDLKATLTQELAKYNIAADQLTKLLSALEVP